MSRSVHPSAPKARVWLTVNGATTYSGDVDIDDVEESSGESLRFKRASVGRTTMRMLTRGSYAEVSADPAVREAYLWVRT